MKSQSGLFENQCTELTVLKMGEDLFRFTSFNLGEPIKLTHIENWNDEIQFWIWFRNDTWNFKYDEKFDSWTVWTNNVLVNGKVISGVWKAITRQQIINGEFYNVR